MKDNITGMDISDFCVESVEVVPVFVSFASTAENKKKAMDSGESCIDGMLLGIKAVGMEGNRAILKFSIADMECLSREILSMIVKMKNANDRKHNNESDSPNKN